jgi:hypothetical protein
MLSSLSSYLIKLGKCIKCWLSAMTPSENCNVYFVPNGVNLSTFHVKTQPPKIIAILIREKLIEPVIFKAYHIML